MTTERWGLLQLLKHGNYGIGVVGDLFYLGLA